MRNYFILFLFAALTGAFGQYTEYSPDFSFIFQPVLQDSIHHSPNFYDFAGNPAGLFEDESAFSLWAGGHFFRETGPYRLIYQPEEISEQQFSVRLVKPLTERDIFKGYFGFQRQADYSMPWFHQSRMLGLNTLVLGDSTSGDFILNGIFWSGQWAHRFEKNLVTAVSVYYNVDQRLKQIFPKPENRHRDIHAKLGIQYSWKEWKTGLVFLYFDEQEKVQLTRYNLDQDLTPVLYKFRFSDLPVVLFGKTSEERTIEYGGPLINFHIGKILSRKNHLMGKVRYSWSDGKVTDGGSQPQPQGSFNRTDAEASVMARFMVFRNTHAGASYQYLTGKFNTEPPEFDLDAIEHSWLIHRAGIFLKQKLNSSFSLFGDILYENYHKKYLDRMTVNFYEFTRQRIFASLGSNFSLSERWEQKVWIGAGTYLVEDDQRTNNKYSSFFDGLFIRTFEYYTQQKTDLGAGLQLIYHYGPVFDIELAAEYRQNSAENFSPGNTRDNIFLLLMVKFFIL